MRHRTLILAPCGMALVLAAAWLALHRPATRAPLIAAWNRALASTRPTPVIAPAPPASAPATVLPATTMPPANNEPKPAPQEIAATPPEPTSSACPSDMVLAKGSHCFEWEQLCLRWDDPVGQPLQRVCGEFQRPSKCTARRQDMSFCIDRDEYVLPNEQLPAKAVSYTQADMICTSLGKRICTNVEWTFACEGEEGLPYPYGYERSSALCNTDRLLTDGKYRASSDLRQPSHATCVSPFGVRDMVGNVDEWVRKPWETAPNRSELRGGWWMTGRNRCRANTSHHDERYAGPQTGFRCCKDAPAGGRTIARVAAPPVPR